MADRRDAMLDGRFAKFEVNVERLSSMNRLNAEKGVKWLLGRGGYSSMSWRWNDWLFGECEMRGSSSEAAMMNNRV